MDKRNKGVISEHVMNLKQEPLLNLVYKQNNIIKYEELLILYSTAYSPLYMTKIVLIIFLS